MTNTTTHEDEYKKKKKHQKDKLPLNKCIYANCELSYARPVGLKRHLRDYDHAAFGFVDLDVENNNNKIVFDFKEKKQKYVDQNNEVVKIDIVQLFKRNDELGQLIRTAFPVGVLKVKSADKLYFCCIPGCGKNFKSGLAYKYHCKTFLHSFKEMVSIFERKCKYKLDFLGIENLIGDIIGAKNEFEISGLTHHTNDSPDGDYNVRFSTENKPKRKKKKRLNASFNPPKIDCEDFKCDYSGRIDRVIMAGQEHEIDDMLTHDTITIKNTHKTITAATKFKNSSFFAVALRERNEKTRTFEFSNEWAEIQIYDEYLELLNKKQYDFGFVRKMEAIQKDGLCMLTVLFNDGLLREIKFKNDFLSVFTFEIEKIIDFSVSTSSNTILATNGSEMYKIVDKNVALQSTKFHFPIVSLAIREVKSKVGDKKKGIEGAEFFYLDTNGRLLRCNSEFRSSEEIYNLTGVTGIKYIEEAGVVVVVDSFDHLTRYIKMSRIKEAHVLIKAGVLTTTSNGDKIYGGSFDGTVNMCNMKRKKVKSVPVFRIVRRRNSFFLCFNENELSFWETKAKSDFDKSIVIVGTCLFDNKLIVSCANGLIISFFLA